jgi:hypothetical protein
MPLVAASLAHVYSAIDSYLAAQLVMADGTPVVVKLHGVRRFVPPSDAPWVEAHYDFLGLQQTFRNRTGQQVASGAMVATERQGYLQLNCYQRARVFAQRYTAALVRDVVIGAFPDGEQIPILDDIGVPEAVLRFDGTQEHQLDTGSQSGVIQMVIQVMTRYWELATRSA